MRIIAGKYKGRKLIESSHFKDLRPTSDKNRENLFNILFSSKKIKETNFDIENCDFLDVFAGSGAVAFEALSRGAKSATLIDKNRDHLNLAKENSQILDAQNIEYFTFDLSRKIPSFGKSYNLIFIDPPYDKNLAAISLQNLLDSGWIANNAIIVVEHSDKEKLENISENFEILEERKYKDTVFTFLKKNLIY